MNAIVQDKKKTYWMMKKNDFRFNSPEYKTVSDVITLSDYRFKKIGNHGLNVRTAHTHDAGKFEIYSDWSAKKL